MDSTCLEVRRELTTDPKSRKPEILQHLSVCDNCADFSQETKAFENQLATALKVEVPEGLESRILLAQRMAHHHTPETRKRSNYTWMSLAAGIVLAIGLLIGMYKLGETHGLEHQVMAHVYDELNLLEQDDNIQLAALNALLEPHGLQANEHIGHVRHATNCPFGDKFVPHIILEYQGMPVTVIFIPWENVDSRIAVNDKRFKGTLFSEGKGSFAIVSEDREAIEGIENRLVSSIISQT